MSDSINVPYTAVQIPELPTIEDNVPPVQHEDYQSLNTKIQELTNLVNEQTIYIKKMGSSAQWLFVILILDMFVYYMILSSSINDLKKD